MNEQIPRNMKRTARSVICFLIFSGSIFFSFAQKKGFSEDPNSFLPEFVNKINATRDTRSRDIETSLTQLWTTGAIDPDQKTQFISLVNKMLAKQVSLSPGITNFASAFVSVNNELNYISLEPKRFLEVTEKCLPHMKEDRLNKYFSHLIRFLPSGSTSSRKKLSWRSTDPNPKFEIIELKGEGKTYVAPVFRFLKTDLVFQSAKDSSTIYDTAGDFNLISQSFNGRGGRVNWSKLQLDPEDVYCVFRNYKLNFNFGQIDADSVDFYYNSLIKEPIIGKFVDKNLGFKNINTANYPVFRSYEGGVVIENFIPDVRYEGGFMLKGIRKIGSAYDVFVESKPNYAGDPELSSSFFDEYIREEANSDEFGEDEWETENNEEWESEDEEFVVFSDDVSFEEEEDRIKTRFKAKLEIKRNDNYVMKLLGDSFVLDPEKLIGKGVEATIYVTEEDSLYHPSMDLRYTVADRTVTLFKPKKGTAKSIPFTSSYHKYFLYFEAIIWKLDTDDIEFTAFIDRENKVYAIESFDYFTKARFNQFRNLLKFNPIGAIYRYALKNKGQSIFPEDIVKEYKLMDQLAPFERSLPALEGSGFITYNRQTKEIIPLDKLFLWARAARGKKDFDAVQVISKVETGSHAMMNINSQDITMNGVTAFSLSDSQYVKIIPLEEKVSVQQNRNLLFAGRMAAGKLNFYANDQDNRPKFTFNYDAFTIHCDSLDSIKFVLVRNPPSGYEPTPLELALSNTVFENITGTLHLDDPRNKSGKEINPEYPIFDSHSSSYLYWSKPSIQDGIYEKEKLYFSLNPFVLDSVENFENTQLKFEGEFFSSEITPKFDQVLTVMPDFTLGFVKETEENEETNEEEPIDMYNYRGKLFGKMVLDGSGLYGRGKLEHLDAVVVSDSFIFHFDSVMAIVENFNMPGSYKNPEVESGQAVYKWYPKMERIALETTNQEPINIYGDRANFEGKLFLSRNGLVGEGSITLGAVKITGDSIAFRERYFKAANSTFSIIDTIDNETVHFMARNVDIDYDLSRQSSRFESKGRQKTLADFPEHQFLTSLTKGDFDVGRNMLSLRGYGGAKESNYFISSRFPNDSLRLLARTASFDVNSKEIEINDVPPIEVADALIIPSTRDLTIFSDGTVKSLEDAVIEANRETKYHKIYEANVNLISNSKYTGSGKYDYIEVQGKPQFINFEQIEVNDSIITSATGEIKESQKFYLTDRIFFRGTASLNASQKFLTFEGEVQIESENTVFKNQWFTFEKTVVNPDSIFIPISESLTNTGGDILTAGLHFAPYSKVFYSNFLQAKDNDEDVDVITASGGLTLDRKTQEFKIGTEAKIKGKTYKGSMVSFSDVDDVITSQGKLNFVNGFKEKTIDIEMAGAWKDDIKNRSLSTNLLVGVDMPIIPDDALDELVKTLQFFVSSFKDIDFYERSMVENISELLDDGKSGDKETEKFLKERDNAMVYTQILLAERLQNTLSLSHVNFNYNRDHKALFCNGEIGLIGINGKTINKMVDAKIVYAFGGESPTGEIESDKLTVYLEFSDPFNWIYFHYEEDVLKTYSAYKEYNEPIEDALSKQNEDASGFRLELSSEDEKDTFIEDFVIKFIKGND